MGDNKNILSGQISAQIVRQARADAELSHRHLVEVLADATGLSQPAVIHALGQTFHYPVLTMEDINLLAPAFDVIDFSNAVERTTLAFRNDKNDLIVVFGNPIDERLQNWVENFILEPFTWYLMHPADISAFLSRQEESMRAMDSILGPEDDIESAVKNVQELSIKSISEDTSPVIKLVHSTLYDALRTDASDIHLETNNNGLVIKYRVDGVLITIGSAEGLQVAEQVISRIKVISELDIAETRVPQDGRFKVSMRGRDIDVRVSIMPSLFGEDAVLRILDKQALSDQSKGLRLDYLGFDEVSIANLRKMANEPYGMMLVTGPTGSGKTTTLYAAITEINRGEDKIITIEDPVEYQLPGILQIPVNEKKGLTFARGLRSILRHDPDKIMVGEIRDPETAQIAIQSALTGHLVFTTVHANNVLDVIGRFMHMGVDLYSFVSAMNGILAQRLVRVNCPQCVVPDQPDLVLLKSSELTLEDVVDYNFQVGRGCGHCRGTGYKGRKAIAELMTLNDEIREMIIGRAPARLIREAASRNGTRFLREAALDLVRNGETTLREINRVTFVA
ncbi:MAG: GspE/PulE family protein [Methylotenera sp.]